MYYETRVGDDTYMLLEAAAVGTLTKSEGMQVADPMGAFFKAIELTSTVARCFDDKLGETTRDLGMDAEITFSILCDGNGLVMMSQKPEGGQFRCTLRISAPLD